MDLGFRKTRGPVYRVPRRRMIVYWSTGVPPSIDTTTQGPRRGCGNNSNCRFRIYGLGHIKSLVAIMENQIEHGMETGMVRRYVVQRLDRHFAKH